MVAQLTVTVSARFIGASFLCFSLLDAPMKETEIPVTLTCHKHGAVRFSLSFHSSMLVTGEPDDEPPEGVEKRQMLVIWGMLSLNV